jgi:hypothetical protein
MPVNAAVSTAIHEYLDTIERERGVKILFAVEAGSRAWGCHSPNSDYDVRFVYRRPLNWYLSIHERRDVLEPKFPDPYDITGWDVRKALFQIYRGNPQFHEWLHSPIWYWGDRAPFEKLAIKYFNPRAAIYHYLHMAHGNWRDYFKHDQALTKKYFYVIRPLLACRFIADRQSIPPVRIDNLNAYAVDVPNWTDLQKRKLTGEEFGMGPRYPDLDAWIVKELDKLSAYARVTPRVSSAPDDLDEFFYDAITAGF